MNNDSIIKQQDNEQKMDFIKRCIDVYWEHYANSSHEDNLNDWNISQNILNKQ
jgi:hypothetical protein